MEDGLEKISRILMEEAKQESARILGESKKKAADILRASRNRADSKKEDIFAQAKREADAHRENELAKARMEARVGLLNAKDTLADSVFEQALSELSALKKKKAYSRMVSEMVCRMALEGEGQLIVSKEDSGVFNRALLSEMNARLAKKNAKVSLSREHRDMCGGFVLSYPQQGVELNRTFEALIAESKERNMPRVAKLLFGADNNG